MNFANPAELNVLAGEYVLGVLPPPGRAQFEQELARNAALERAVYAWQDRMLRVAPMPDPVVPGPQLWARIARDLGAPARQRRTRIEMTPPSFWSSLDFWRWASAAAVTASVVLASMLWLALTPATERYVAVLLAADNRAAWIVEADQRQVRLRPLAVTAVAPRRALQFWTKPDGAAGPTSLGLVPGDRPVVIPATRLPGLSANQLFEVTLEPETGSPIGRPTGPILAVGRAVKI